MGGQIVRQPLARGRSMAAQQRGQSGDLANGKKVAPILFDQLSAAVGSRGDDRRTCVEGLQHDQRQWFAARWADEQVECLVVVLDVPTETGQGHVRTEQSLQPATFAAFAKDNEPGVGRSAARKASIRVSRPLLWARRAAEPIRYCSGPTPSDRRSAATSAASTRR